MFNIFSAIAAAFAIKDIAKEKLEKPVPKGTYFDQDAYWEDIRNGMSAQEQIKKQQRGGYRTTKRKVPLYELPIDTIRDVERYEYEKKMFGKDTVDRWSKTGRYILIKPYCKDGVWYNKDKADKY